MGLGDLQRKSPASNFANAKLRLTRRRAKKPGFPGVPPCAFASQIAPGPRGPSNPLRAHGLFASLHGPWGFAEQIPNEQFCENKIATSPLRPTGFSSVGTGAVYLFLINCLQTFKQFRLGNLPIPWDTRSIKFISGRVL
jgi:hypothetical protein